MIERFQTPRLSPYLFNPDETHATNLAFESAVKLFERLANDQELELSDSILIIELPEGVFIRSNSRRWCETLTDFSNTSVENLDFRIIPEQQWTEITRKYRQPINSFGDNRLVRWRVGF